MESRELTTNATHGTLGLLEIRLTDMVAILLLPDDFPQIVANRVIGINPTQFRTDVVLVDAEKACSNFSIGCQAQAVAVSTEWLADRCNDPNFPPPIRKRPSLGRFRRIVARHRLEREAQILAALKDGVAQIPEIVNRIYVGLDPRLIPAAALSVLAHLLELMKQGRAVASGEPGIRARYRPVQG